jgi:excisionase family DNA binding protein
MSERMYEVKEASAEMHVSPSLTYALCAAKRIRHVRIGVRRGKVLIPASAIAEFLKSREVGVDESPTSEALTHIQRSRVG